MSIGWMNGEIRREEEMVLSVRDLGVLRGYGVFDFLRTYGKRPFQQEDHLGRLEHSAREIGLTLPYGRDRLKQAVAQVLEAFDGDEAGLRIVCTGGLSRDGLTSREGNNLFILADPVKVFPAELYRKGAKVITHRHRRYRPESKSLNYIPALQAMGKARDAGALEALYCDESDRILEGTTSNLFLWKDGFWRTPGRDILKGVTRQVVIKLIGLDQVRREDLTLTDLAEAEEIFITSSSKEVMPVTRVDDRSCGDGPGPETRRVMTLFQDYVTRPDKWFSTEEVG